MQTSRKPLAPVTDQGKPVQYMTTEEVAVWLQIAQKTLRNWKSAGIGPPTVKLFSAVRYDRAVVEAWIDDTSKAAA
ncbi:helix-turn-helix domain-containing protein [Micrococcaceae bacterium Sec7.4]